MKKYLLIVLYLLKLKSNLKKVGYSFLSVIEFDKNKLAGSSSKQNISLT